MGSTYFNTLIIAQKPDGTIIKKECNNNNADEWAYLFKTWGWFVLEIKELTRPD